MARPERGSVRHQLIKTPPAELSLLCKSAWQGLRIKFRQAASDPSAIPGVIISIHTYGRDPVPFHPDLHCLASDCSFSRDGRFLFSAGDSAAGFWGNGIIGYPSLSNGCSFSAAALNHDGMSHKLTGRLLEPPFPSLQEG
jgi:hypothetical protein